MAPRRDYSDFDDDLREALITCYIQLSSPDNRNVYTKEVTDFMNEFLSQLVELRLDLFAEKFSYERLKDNKSKEGNMVSVKTETSVSSSGARAISKHIAKAEMTAELMTPDALNSQGNNQQPNSMSKLFRMKSPKNGSGSKNANTSSTRSVSPTAMENKKELWKNVSNPARERTETISSETSNTTANNVSMKGRSSRKRNKQVNAEASVLRSHIAAKEYEVQRFEKLVKRRTQHIQVQSKKSPSTNFDADRQQEDVDSLAAQREELEKLKTKYTDLTGLSYGESSVFGQRRIRRVRGNSDLGVNDTAATPILTKGPAALKSGTPTVIASSPVRDSASTNAKTGEDDVLARVDVIMTPARTDGTPMTDEEMATFRNSGAVGALSHRESKPMPQHWCIDDRRKIRSSESQITFIILIIFSICFSVSLAASQFLSTYIASHHMDL